MTLEDKIQQELLEQRARASAVTGQSKNLEKAFNDSVYNDIEKGKRAVVGEIREWSDGKYRRTSTGWEPVKDHIKTHKVEGNNIESKKDPDSLFVYKDGKYQITENSVREFLGKKTMKGIAKWITDRTIERLDLQAYNQYSPNDPTDTDAKSVKDDILDTFEDIYSRAGGSH